LQKSNTKIIFPAAFVAGIGVVPKANKRLRLVAATQSPAGLCSPGHPNSYFIPAIEYIYHIPKSFLRFRSVLRTALAYLQGRI